MGKNDLVGARWIRDEETSQRTQLEVLELLSERRKDREEEEKVEDQKVHRPRKRGEGSQSARSPEVSDRVSRARDATELCPRHFSHRSTGSLTCAVEFLEDLVKDIEKK